MTALDPDLLLDQDADEHRAHAALRPRAVRHVHGIDARSPERGHVVHHPAGVDAARRHDLHRRHELAPLRASRPIASGRQTGRATTAGGHRGRA